MFEYKKVTLKGIRPPSAKFLNKHVDGGWKLFQMYYRNGASGDFWYIYFEKVKGK